MKNDKAQTAFQLTTAFILIAATSLSINTLAEEKIKLETTVIKGNTELPKILYLVPWQDIEQDKNAQQKLRLHSLFGDLFEPMTPIKPKEIQTQN